MINPTVKTGGGKRTFSFPRFTQTLYIILALAICITLLIFLRGRIEKSHAVQFDFGELLWVPDARIPHILALGDDNTAADMLWIRSIFYVGAYHGLSHEHHQHADGEPGNHHSGYGRHHREHIDKHEHVHEHDVHNQNHEIEHPKEHHRTGERDTLSFSNVDFREIPIIRNTLKGYLEEDEALHMYHLFNVITDLDPMFATPYFQGAMYLLVMAGRWEDALKLLEKGIKNRPDRWEMYYFKGFVNLFYQNDKIAAASELKRSAMQKDAPGYVVRLAATLHAGLGDLETALEFLRTLAEITEDKEMKARIEKQIEAYEMWKADRQASETL